MYKIIKVDKNVKKNIKYFKNKIKKISLRFFIHYEEKNNFIMGLSDKEDKIIFLNLFLFFIKKNDEIFKTILHELIHIFYPNLSENKVEEMTINHENYINNYKFGFVYNLSKFIYQKVMENKKLQKISDFNKMVKIVDDLEYIFKID
jgi:hypothetical protein